MSDSKTQDAYMVIWLVLIVIGEWMCSLLWLTLCWYLWRKSVHRSVCQELTQYIKFSMKKRGTPLYEYRTKKGPGFQLLSLKGSACRKLQATGDSPKPGIC
jgi:hypothetical protein